MNSALHSLSASWPWTTVDVLNHLWQSTVVSLAVLAVLLFGRGLSARTRRALGWMALLKFALPAGFLVQMFARIGATPGRWVESGALTGPIMLPALVVTSSTGEAPARLSAGLVLMVVWFAGFVGLLVSWFGRGRRLRRQIFAEVHPVSGAMERRIVAATRRAGPMEAPRCLAVGSERAPGVLGVVAPIVILPRGLETTLAPAELEAVLIHEFVHVQRRDNLWSAAQALLVSLFWFHPLVWVLNRRIGIETEQSCDERVLEITGDPDTYAGGIVKAVQHALGVAQPGLIGATTPPVITRIKNIFAHGARPDRPLVRTAALAGGGLLLVLSGYTGSFAAPALAPAAYVPAAAPAAPASAVAPLSAVAPAPAAAPTEPTLSVDFPDEDVRRIIRNVADLFQLNVVMPDTLQGKTTVKLRDVTWRQIFGAVLAPTAHTFVEEDNLVKIVAAKTQSAAAPPAGAPVAMGSRSALAAESRLTAQADRLKLEAGALRRETEAKNAAPADDSAAKAESAAALAAIDARRQAVETAVKTTADNAQLAEMAAKREAEMQQQRALAAEDRARPRGMISLGVVEPSSQKMPPTAGLFPARPVAVESEPAPGAAVQEIGGQKVYDPRELNQVPVPKFQARPQYPFALRRAGVSGEATIDFIVDTRGDVVNAFPVKFTHKEFAAAAIEAVGQWQFKPGRKGGRDVFTHMQVPIRFTLKED